MPKLPEPDEHRRVLMLLRERDAEIEYLRVRLSIAESFLERYAGKVDPVAEDALYTLRRMNALDRTHPPLPSSPLPESDTEPDRG